jgi:basic membrane protein A and related proteins
MKRTMSLALALFLIASFVLSACAPAAAPAPAAQEPAKKVIKVVYVVNGTQGDKSFIDSAVRGIRRAEKEFGMQVKIIEAGNDPAKWQPALVDAAANEDYDILIVGSWQMTDFLSVIAPKYPDKKFFIYDTTVDYTKCNCKNVYSVEYKQNEGSYLAGYYAALMTKTNLKGMNPESTLGIVAAQPIPVIDDFVVGFKNGVKDAGLDPEKDVIVQYAGGWTDPAKGKEQALAMYQQGADIVFQVAGGTGEGVFQAALESGKYAIGVDSDQALIEKSTNPALAAVIITSMMKNVDNSLYRAFQKHIDGTLAYGSVEILGPKEGGIGLAYNEYYDKYTPQDVKDKMKQVQADMDAGKIKVDSTFK